VPVYEVRVYYNIAMIELSIPGQATVRLEHLVCDVNGTLAIDGKPVDGVSRILARLRDRLQIHLLTADTYGRQVVIDQMLGTQAVRLKPAQEPGDEARQKLEYVLGLGAGATIAIGQGANDAAMLKAAAIGICILSPEGTATETLLAANLVAQDILSALEMLEKPLRLVATLRR